MNSVKLKIVALFCGLFFFSSLAYALTPNPVETGTPKYGGVLKYGQIAGPASFDPHTRPAWSGSLLVPIFNNLLLFNPEYKEVTLDNLIGDLAERFEISEDGMTYTFWLRKNVKWHDGMPFTADDVVYSMDKMTDPKTGSRVSRWLMAYKSTEKVDDYMVKIHTKYPSPGFAANLANAYCVILPKHKAGTDIKSDDFLVGTGPFMFKSYRPDSKFSMVRNPNYFKKDSAGRQLPYMDGIDIIIVRGTAALDGFIARRFQIYNPVQNLQKPEDVLRVETSAPDAVMKSAANYLPYLIWLNWNFEPFGDSRVRDAIGLIYSQEDDVIARWGTLDFGLLGPGLFPPTFAISHDEITKIMGWDLPKDQRIKKAQRLMREAGYANGFRIRMLYGKYPGGTSEPSMTVLGDKLKRYLNIQYELVGASYAEMHKIRAKGDWEMANEIIYALLPDPDVYMPYFRTGDRSNFTKYSNPVVDALWDGQNREMDPARRLAIVHEIERKLLADHVILPGAFLLGKRVMYPSVKNLRHTAQVYQSEVKLEDVWLDE